MTTPTGWHYSHLHINKEIKFTSWPVQDNTERMRESEYSDPDVSPKAHIFLTTVPPLLVTYNLTAETDT